jgi:hypothetical protein
MTETYERNLRSPRAYVSTAIVGRGGHNPQIKYYYGTSDETELVRIEQRLMLCNGLAIITIFYMIHGKKVLLLALYNN